MDNQLKKVCRCENDVCRSCTITPMWINFLANILDTVFLKTLHTHKDDEHALKGVDTSLIPRPVSNVPPY